MKITRYSVQRRDQVIVKGYGSLSFVKNMGKNIGQNMCKTLSGAYSQIIFDHAKQSATYLLKTASKRAIEKSAEATDDLIVNNSESLELSHRVVQRQVQMKQKKLHMIKKYLKKDIYLQKKGRKLLMIWD